MLYMLFPIREVFYSKHDPRKTQQPIMLQQYLISIDARLRSRNLTVSLKSLTAECLVARLQETQLLRDANIRESRLFMYILNNSDKLFRVG